MFYFIYWSLFFGLFSAWEKFFFKSRYQLILLVFFLKKNYRWYIPHKWIVLFTRCWLASWEVIIQIPFTSGQLKKKKWLYIVTNKVTLRSASYTACVVYTKTIIHLSVSENGRYLCSLRWIIVNYWNTISNHRNSAMSICTNNMKFIAL